jgi:hypothetical protein
MTIKSDSGARIEALVNRLSARKRWVWAARIYGGWLDAQRTDAQWASPPAPSQLWRYGRLLRNAGDNVGATSAFRELALAMAKPETGSVFYLQRSFEEWARCMEVSGSPRSAEKTRALGKRLTLRRARKEQEERGQLQTLAPSRLIRPVASRCTFMLSLEWESESETFSLFVEDGFMTLRERFRFSEVPTVWFEFEAKAPAEPDPRYPHVAVCMKFPWRFVTDGDRLAVLSVVNEMNLNNAATSTSLEPDSGQIAVRARIAYTGLNEGIEPLTDLSAAQEEVTINMTLEVLGMASGWHQQLAKLNAQLNEDLP